MTRCPFCRRFVLPWQRSGFWTLASREERRWHRTCRRERDSARAVVAWIRSHPDGGASYWRIDPDADIELLSADGAQE